MSSQINQRLIVVQLARTRKDVLFGQFSPSLTKKMKEEAWENIRQEAIAVWAEGLIKRDWQYVRDSIWQAAQRDAKAKKDRAKESGEGSVDEVVFDILGRDSPSMVGLDIKESEKGPEIEVVKTEGTSKTTAFETKFRPPRTPSRASTFRMFGEVSSSSESETDEASQRIKKNYKFRQRIEWESSLSISEFRERFRMSPTQAECLLGLIGPKIMANAATNHALTSKQRLLVALRFFATNSPYFSVGNTEHISKGTVTKCVSLVTCALNTFDNLAWPKTENECRKIGADFFKLSKGRRSDLPGFPMVCGAIDGTLIPIEVPRENDIQYVDRHGNHSINVQGVAGPSLLFYSISARWPGSVNDARVFRNSELSKIFDNGYLPFDGAVILGDSIYPVKDYLVPMRPYPEMEEFFRSYDCKGII